MIMEIVLLFLTSYFLVFFSIPLIFFPNNLLIKLKTKNPNKELKKVLTKLNRTKNKEEFVKNCLVFLQKKYPTKRFRLWFNLHKLFWYNPNSIINARGMLPCHVHTLMMKTILIASRKFKEDEIRECYTITDFVIHKYLQVKINDKWLDVDSWAYGVGVPVGKHAFGLGYV